MKNFTLSLVLLLQVVFGLAQSGALDSSFAGRGYFILQEEYYQLGILQPDKRIILVGTRTPRQLIISRFTTEGAVDSSFGAGGSTRVDMGVLSPGPQFVVLQRDGKIVVATTVWPTNSAALILVRVNNDGSMDNSFGTRGMLKIYYGFGTGPFLGRFSIALQKDGKIIVAGPDYTIASNTFSLWRLNRNGSVDSSFGDNGRAFLAGPKEAYTSIVNIQKNGKIVLAGTVLEDQTVVARFSRNGQQDSTYTGSGYTVVPSLGMIVDGVLQRDDKLLLAMEQGRSFHLQRFDKYGNIDFDFGINGEVETFFSKRVLTSSVDLQRDGKIVAAGFFERVPSAYNFGMALARYFPSGSIDSSFGNAGQVMHDFGFSTTGRIIGLDKDRVYMMGIGVQPTYTIIAAFRTGDSPDNCGADKTPPVLDCNGPVDLNWHPGNDYSIPPLKASDNCNIKLVQYCVTGSTSRKGRGINASGIFNIGVSYIQWTVEDYNGNVSKCTTKVTVRRADEECDIHVVAYPNPTSNYFTVTVLSRDVSNKIELKVFDFHKRLVETRWVYSNSQFHIGAQYPVGVYYIFANQKGRKDVLIATKKY